MGCSSVSPGSRSVANGVRAVLPGRRDRRRAPLPWPRRASAPEDVGLLINTSVTRPHLEPSVAVRLHHGLGLPSSAIQLRHRERLPRVRERDERRRGHDRLRPDQVRARRGRRGRRPGAAQHHRAPDQGGRNRKDFMSEFASLTLGSGAAAAVLGPADMHPGGHRIVGGVTRAATSGTTSASAASTDVHRREDAPQGRHGTRRRAWNEARSTSTGRHGPLRAAPVSDVHTNAFVEAIGVPRDKVPPRTSASATSAPRRSRSPSRTRSPRRHPPRRPVFLGGVGSGINTANDGTALVTSGLPRVAAATAPATPPPPLPGLDPPGRASSRSRPLRVQEARLAPSAPGTSSTRPAPGRARRGTRRQRCCACTANRRGRTCGGRCSAPRSTSPRPAVRHGGSSRSTSSTWGSRSGPARSTGWRTACGTSAR